MPPPVCGVWPDPLPVPFPPPEPLDDCEPLPEPSPSPWPPALPRVGGRQRDDDGRDDLWRLVLRRDGDVVDPGPGRPRLRPGAGTRPGPRTAALRDHPHADLHGRRRGREPVGEGEARARDDGRLGSRVVRRGVRHVVVSVCFDIDLVGGCRGVVGDPVGDVGGGSVAVLLNVDDAQAGDLSCQQHAVFKPFAGGAPPASTSRPPAGGDGGRATHATSREGRTTASERPFERMRNRRPSAREETGRGRIRNYRRNRDFP